MKTLMPFLILAFFFFSCKKVIPDKPLNECLDIELTESTKIDKSRSEYLHFGLIAHLNSGITRKTSGLLNGAYPWENYKITMTNAKYLGNGKAVINSRKESDFFKDYQVIVEVVHLKKPFVMKKFVIQYPKPEKLLISNGSTFYLKQTEAIDLFAMLVFDNGSSASLIKHPIYEKHLKLKSEGLVFDAGKVMVGKLGKPVEQMALEMELDLGEKLVAKSDVMVSYSQQVFIEARRLPPTPANSRLKVGELLFLPILLPFYIIGGNLGFDGGTGIHGKHAKDVTLFITKEEEFDKIHRVTVKMEDKKYSFFIRRDQFSKVHIEASGTDGARGGDGSRGYNGNDATEKWRASRGGDGGDGGNGGSGGNGGNIIIYYDEGSKGVLPLISFNNRGGRGGAGGSGGSGGSGGRNPNGSIAHQGRSGGAGAPGSNGVNGNFVSIPIEDKNDFLDIGLLDE